MKKLFITFLCATLLVFVFDPAVAGNWYYQTTLSSQIEGDDNKRLRRRDEEGVVGVDLRGTVELSRKTETSEIYLRGTLRSARYDGDEDSGLDTDDQLLYAGGRWIGERSELTINGDFRRESSLLTELEDTGLFEDVERRVTKSISPQYTYNLFENTSVTAGASYTDVEYPNTIPFSLTEYDFKSVNAGIIHTLTERSSISLGVFHSIYEADTFDNDVDTTGANLGYSFSPDEFWLLFASVGYRDSRFRNNVNGANVRDDDTGALYEATAIRQSETVRLELALRNELQPSSSGNVNERTEYEFNLRKMFSERISGSLNFLWLENESVNDDNDTNDREYWSFSIGGDYRLTPHWYLTGSYRHRDQSFDNAIDSSSANSDAVIFGVRYSGQETQL